MPSTRAAADSSVDKMTERIDRCDAAFKQIVLLRCYDALAAAGFTRFKKEAVDWPLDAGFSCWVGLSTGISPDYVEICPMVGVQVAPIDRLWKRLTTGKYGGKYSRDVATYGVPMGSLAGGESSFKFFPRMDLSAQAARLAHEYATTGLAFARSIASYDLLLPLLKERAPIGGGYPQRVACCLYLMGRYAEARTWIEEFPPQRSEYLESFSIPFLQMLAEAPVQRV
jgi:hypothetical protein